MQHYKKISNFIFLSCIIVSIISFTSLIFPRLLIEISNNKIQNNVNIFEFGGWALPLIISNVIFLIFYFLHKKNRLPLQINQILKYVNDKNISKKTSFIVLIILFLIYIIFTYDEFSREEFELGDYRQLPEHVKTIQITDSIISPNLRYFLLHVSYVMFDNLRVLPFIASISLLLLTYFIALEITGNRLGALVAFSILLQSNLFLLFDTTSVYENFWTAFYFLSIYLIFKKPIGSHISFFLSIISKPIAITLIPVNLIAIKASQVSKRNKLFLTTGYLGLIILILIAYFTGNLIHVVNPDLNFNKFIAAISEFGNSFRYETLILIMFFPTLLILKNKSNYFQDKTNFIFTGLMFAMLSQPLMHFVIGMTLQPYREIPLLVFSAISIGMIFTHARKVDHK